MTAQAEGWAWKQKLDPLPKLLLICLANHADYRGCCSPPIERLEKDTGMSRRSVFNQLRTLEEAGLLVISKEASAIGTNLYQLVHDPSAPATMPAASTGEAHGKRPHPLPPDWEPGPELIAWAERERPDLGLATCVAMFCDHFTANENRKTDWNAAFRNWIRREHGGVGQRSDAKPRHRQQAASSGIREAATKGMEPE